MACTNQIQYKVFIILLLGVVGATGILTYSNPLLFQRFIGEIRPLIAILLSGGAGFVLLSLLEAKTWFTLYKRGNFKGSFRYSGLVVLFTTIAILVDWKIVLPEDMNILFPESLLFYPTIGFFVEILFHVLPLSVLLFLLNSIFKNINHEKLIGGCIVFVAMLEPTYQAIFMGMYSIWAIVIIWINLFLFNLTQLFIFKKYDFISMYIFRLIYYAIWHIAWGYFRLEFLF